MNNFEFANPVKVVFGKGSIAKLPQLLPADTRVLMVYGGGSIKKNGIYDQVVAALQGFDRFEFGGIEANPHYETCMKAVHLVKKENVNFLLAVGGGSVIDATKFIAMAALFEGEPWDVLTKKAPVRAALPLGTVLTLSATGSETNERAVISRVETGEKLMFLTPSVFPQFAVLDPQVTYSLPARQVANGVVDSFIHVIEQYLTYPAGAKVQDYFAESLMRTIVEEGPRALSEPDNYDVRANLMWAATNALNGWIGCGVPQDWSSHRMGYSLTAQFGLDHAQTLAVLLPGVMSYFRKEKEAKLLRMGEVLWNITSGTTGERVQATINATEAFFRQMGIKTRLGEYGIGESDLDALVEPMKRMDWKLGEYGLINYKVAKEIMKLRL